MESICSLVRVALNLLHVLHINAQAGQRYSVVVRCSYSLLQDGVPYMFVGQCEPANCQLLYVFCLLLLVSSLK